jgi:hypothetical protein
MYKEISENKSLRGSGKGRKPGFDCETREFNIGEKIII